MSNGINEAKKKTPVANYSILSHKIKEMTQHALECTLVSQRSKVERLYGLLVNRGATFPSNLP